MMLLLVTVCEFGVLFNLSYRYYKNALPAIQSNLSFVGIAAAHSLPWNFLNGFYLCFCVLVNIPLYDKVSMPYQIYTKKLFSL